MFTYVYKRHKYITLFFYIHKQRDYLINKFVSVFIFIRIFVPITSTLTSEELFRSESWE